MKKFLLLPALVFSIIANAQDAKLKGTVKNPLADSVYVDYFPDHIIFLPARVAAGIDEKGNFAMSIPVADKYMAATLTHGSEQSDLVLGKGMDLTLTVDGQRFDSSLKFTGKGSEVANFLAAHTLQRGMFLQYSSKGGMAMMRDKKDVSPALEGFRKEEETFMNRYKTLPADFKKYWMSRYDYTNHYFRAMYPMAHRQMKQQMGTPPHDSVDLSFPTPPGAFNDDLLGITEYRMFVSGNFLQQFYNENDRDGYRRDDSMMRVLHKTLPPKTAEYINAFIIYMKRSHYSLPAMKEMVANYKSMYPNMAYGKQLNASLAMKEKFAAGSPAPDFVLKTQDGKFVHLSDYKGKVVYIDFWASWCKPCLGEIPHAKTLHEHFANNKDFVVLAISIDENTAAWKKAIERLQPPGIHGIDNGGWSGTIARAYNIEGVPSYFLIDKDGNFALDTTPRPSQQAELIAAIEKLLR